MSNFSLSRNNKNQTGRRKYFDMDLKYFSDTGSSIKRLFMIEISDKVHIFWEGHKFLWNLHRTFVLCSNGQIYGGDFAKFCGLLRIYEL